MYDDRVGQGRSVSLSAMIRDGVLVTPGDVKKNIDIGNGNANAHL